MDLNSILNQNDNSAAAQPSTTPKRSSSFAQPPLPPQPYTQRQSPSLTRQTSLPSYPHHAHPDYSAQPHTSYAPNMVEYFREGSESVSPRTVPTPIPREGSYNSKTDIHLHRSPSNGVRPDLAPTSTPLRVHVRDTSTHSINSNVSSHHMDRLTQSPQHHHSASITPSPVQGRPHEYFPPTRSTISPSENHQMPPPLYHQSPTFQNKSMPPPTTPTLKSSIPPPYQAQTPTQMSPGPPLQNQPQTPVMSIHPVTESPVIAQRKRSLESVGETQPAIKRLRQETPPIWAKRIQWDEHKPMEMYVPKPKQLKQATAPVAQPKSRIPSVTDAGINGTVPVVGQRPWEAQLHASREYSLDNIVPYNELHRVVADFLHDKIINELPAHLGHIEIEARFGLMIDPGSNMRPRLPFMTESVIRPDAISNYNFESRMDAAQHRLLNQYLNSETERSLRTKGRVPIHYKRSTEKDSSFDVPDGYFKTLPQQLQDYQSNLRHKPRIRVTTDPKTGQIKAQIIKIRMADLQIFCPCNYFDIRISVSAELNYPHSVDGLRQQLDNRGVPQSRTKDRLSYIHQDISVDLTQVTSTDGVKVHELELEIDTNLLTEHARLVNEGQPNDYEELVGILLNHVKALNRACGAVSQFT